MKKILIIITTSFVQYGGLTSVMMNYYKNVTNPNIQIDFASTNVPDSDDDAYKCIIQNRSKYFCLGNRKKNPIRYMANLKRLLQNENYDIVHINGNSSTMLIELFVSKSAGVQERIAHGHTTKTEHPLFHMALKGLLKKYCTKAIAVSEETGDWLFGNSYIVLNNAIDPSVYFFNPEKRDELREKYQLQEAFVVGNVGKLYSAKNQSFIIDVLVELKKRLPQTKLVLVGGGILEKELRNKCKLLNVSNDVVFMGMRDDIPDLLNMFDCFVFPSIYEGFGLALVEAQASGLKCVASDNVPQTTNVTGNVKYMNLKEPIETWADEIKLMRSYDRMQLSLDAQTSIMHCGFDIRVEAGKLEEIYNE